MFNLNKYRLVYIAFLSILIVNVPPVPSVFAKDYRVITVEHNIDMGDNDGKDLSITDFYLNAGHENGVREGMLLDVYRPKSIVDSITSQRKRIRVLIGKLKVIDVYKDISIARIDTLEPLSSNPIVNYRTVMIGDYLKPPVAPVKRESASGASLKTTMIIPANILFDYNSWKLKPEASTVLKKMAKHIKSPEDVLFIEGHTCNAGTKDHNLRLSRKRAESAATYLKTLKNIPGKQIITIGYGAGIPIAPNDTEENRAKNRRVEFKIIPASQVSFVK